MHMVYNKNIHIQSKSIQKEDSLMSLKINPYLNFMGRTEEAFVFYKSVFGGEFTSLQQFKDIPGLPGKEQMSEADLNKLMHVSLPIGNNVLMGTDTLESLGHTLNFGNNISLSIDVDSKDEADRLFKALSEGGKVEMALHDTFWNAYFGMVEDQFGIKWMINCETKN